MKKSIAWLLTVCMLFSATACKSDDSEETQARTEAPSAAVTEPPRDLAVPHKGPSSTEAAAAPTGELVIALNAAIDGETSLSAETGTALTAQALIPEGMALDYWCLNGEPQADAREDSFSFTTEGQTVVEAVLRPELTVTAVNANMQFLNQNKSRSGQEFTEFVFEDDYVNPVTGENIPGGTVSVYVRAKVPQGMNIEYWLINGVPYYFNSYVSGFRVMDLKESTVFEPVFYGVQPQTVRPADPVDPPPSETPVTYYTVTCANSAFSGGGVSGSSGKVPAGTVITVWSTVGEAVDWTGNYKADFWNGAPSSFSYTVNSDCYFKAWAVIN